MLPSIDNTCMCDTWVFEGFLGCNCGLISKKELSHKHRIIFCFWDEQKYVYRAPFPHDFVVLLPLNLEEKPKSQLLAQYSCIIPHNDTRLAAFFRLLSWFRLKQLHTVHINMFTEMKSTAKWVHSWLLTFDAGSSLSRPGTLWEGLHFQSSRKKRGKKASYMFTGYTAFLLIKLFCKEKLFIERSHLLIYSVCSNH